MWLKVTRKASVMDARMLIDYTATEVPVSGKFGADIWYVALHNYNYSVKEYFKTMHVDFYVHDRVEDAHYASREIPIGNSNQTSKF